MGYDGSRRRRTVKYLPHARLLLALSFELLLCSSALALVPKLARAAEPVHAQELASALPRSATVVNVWQLRAERRERFEQAPLHSGRMLLPEFVLCDDAPDDEDVANLRVGSLQFYPEHGQTTLDEVARSPHVPPRDLLERPPRA